jgi:hypothetical protein
LASDRVHITDEAQACLNRLNPRELGWFAGVVALLESDGYRNEWKTDLSLLDEYGGQVWALCDENLFVAFTEQYGRIDVVFVNRRSGFRPPLNPFS